MVYSWKSGSRIKADANQAGKQFEELSKTVGLNAENVVEANKPAEAVLHDEFEWDNTTAAEEWRKHQARHLMNCICITVKEPNAPKSAEETKVRAFFTVKESSYEHVNVIISDNAKRAALLGTAKRELLAFRCKYNTLSELSAVFSAIDDIVR